MKLDYTLDKNDELVAPSRVVRETTAIHKARNVMVELTVGGLKVWLKGKRDFYVVPYATLFIDAEKGSVNIPGRRVSAADLAKIVDNRNTGA